MEKMDTIFYVIENKTNSCEYISTEKSETKHPSTNDIYEAVQFLNRISAQKIVDDCDLGDHWEVTEHMFQVSTK